jgi:ParB-like chromosome segregation protein Spo0J
LTPADRPAAYPEPQPAVVGRLRARRDVRGGPLDEGHVASLTEMEGRWPPLLVWAEQPDVVIDGAHRLAAARRLGLATVMVTLFHGSADEAFIEAVRRNGKHGLPLTRAERVRAAERILRRNPDWSDRRIAELCALSPHTVAPLRTRRAGIRLGRDGKLRPVDTVAVRDRVAEALRANPGASLRAVARVAGASPETVRRVRNGSRPAEHVEAWHEDQALATSPDLGEFVEWFERTDPGEQTAIYAARVPLGRIYTVADEARRRAARWAELAWALEARASRR